MESQKQSCNCSSKEELFVVSCSGASDIGCLSDQVARKLRDNSIRAMKCLAMIAADNQPLIESFKSANVLVIDGCPIDCGKKIMDKAGISNYNYLRITDHGFTKGQSPVNDKNLETIYQIAESCC